MGRIRQRKRGVVKKKFTKEDSKKYFRLQKKLENENYKKFVPAAYDDWTMASYKNITEGSIFLGCIKTVTEYHLIVSLPNRLIGFVSLRDLSSSYAKLLTEAADGGLEAESILMLQDIYSAGEFIVVQVKSIVNNDGRINVSLTTEPIKTNTVLRGSPLAEGTILQCSVTSETDNGFIMDTGLPTVRAAFLPQGFVKDNCAIGKVLLCFVLSMEKDEGTSLLKVRLSAQAELLASVLLRDNCPFSSFYPGSAADVKITKVDSYGLRVKCGANEGIVSKQHLPVPFQKANDYKIGEVLRARVLYTTALPNLIYFSTLPVICSMGTEDPSVQTLKNMQTINDAYVYDVSDNEVHLYLRGDFCGVCATNQINDDKKNTKLGIGSNKHCRVLGYSPMDDIYIVGLKPSILNEKVYSVDDLNVGELVKVKVIKVVESGAVIKLGKLVKGFIPKIHLKELNVGREDEIPARVLTFKENGSVFFTIRDDLVKLKLPPVTEFNSESIGTTVAGVVFAVTDSGIKMEFFNGATGFLPTTLFSPDMSMNQYEVGSLVECKVEFAWSSNSALLTMIDSSTA